MEKVCNLCNSKKSISDFRNRNTCKTCENKQRYERKKIQRLNPEYDKKCREYDVKRKRKNERENSLVNFKQLIRASIRKSFKRKGYTKKSKSYIILGEDWDLVKLHFESLFKPGMSWDNYGLWEIDHIKPLSLASTEDEVTKLCHYKNLQPLWKEENRTKGDIYN